MASENWPTYVILAIYVLLTALVTFAAKKKNSDPEDKNSDVTKHFLGSKNFGPVLLTFTTFASVFSGYTVVGVPNEAGSSGFRAVRWMGLIGAIGASMLWLYPRLRRLSIVHNFESPGDFIHYRYKSRTLSITVAILLCFPQILYIGVNLFSIGSTLESLTGGELSFYWVVVVCTIMILLFEALGGMRSVAYTDAVEAIVMLVIFVTVPCMIGGYYGGFGGQVNNSEDLTIPCSNSYDEDSNGCLNYVTKTLDIIDDVNSTQFNFTEFNSTGYDEVPELEEYYLRSPSSCTILNYVLFCIGGLSFSLNPHVCQRALTAKEDSHVRIITVAIFLATFVTMTPGLLTGITALSNDWEGAAFPAMLSNFEERGGFAAFVSYVALLAGIAGIMSTADSALIGVSNTLSVDIFKNHVFPTKSSKYIVYVGKVISLITMSLCLGFAILMYNNPNTDYGSVYTVQQGLLWQSVPAYVFGLYTRVSAKAVLTGTGVGVLTCIICLSVIFSNDRAHDPFPLVDKSWATFLAVALNVVASLIAHYTVFPESTDAEDRLSLDKIRKTMNGIREPITYYGGALVYICFAMTIIVAFHWIGEIDPELLEEYGRDYAEEIMYNGTIRNVIGGLPDYVFATIMWYLAAIILGIYATLQWDVSIKDTVSGRKGSHVAQASTTVGQSTDMTSDTAGSENTGQTNGVYPDLGSKQVEMADAKGKTELDDGEHGL